MIKRKVVVSPLPLLIHANNPTRFNLPQTLPHANYGVEVGRRRFVYLYEGLRENVPRSLSYDRPIASSKANSPQGAV
jgi:hypothetical protein